MWSWVTIDHPIGKYYRKLLLLTHGIKLQRPSKDEHVTVTCWYDRPTINPVWWGAHDGMLIDMTVDSTLWWNGNAFWLIVTSPQLDDIRAQLWLDAPYIPFHFCIGYLHE